jgi:hypothetical protein
MFDPASTQPQWPPPLCEEEPEQSGGSIDFYSQPKKGFALKAEKRAMRPEGDGHNFFDVGYHESALPARAPARLLPYVPGGPERVVKTYGHVVKMLNDPGVHKQHAKHGGMPKQKKAVHVSMPRLQSAGSAVARTNTTAGTMATSYTSFGSEYPSAIEEDDGYGYKMLNSRSSPGLLQSGDDAGVDTEAAWQSASMRQRGGEGGVLLPPLAKSAS